MQICHALLHESCIWDPTGYFWLFFLYSPFMRSKTPECKQWTKGIAYHLRVNFAQVTKTPSTRIRRFLYPQFFYFLFFYGDTKISASTRSVYESYTTVQTYPIRIRTSQRISQQSSRGKRLVLILWRQRIQKYTDTSVHKYPDTQRIQKSPDTPSVYSGHEAYSGT